MSTYVIGDIHGCWQTLQRLLDRIGWRPAIDRLWLVGDLVNRGPASLQVLRWAADQSGLVATLGNHDLHLLARAEGLASTRPEDRFDELLAAPDREPLLEWLRSRPFLHREGEVVLVHAGLWPGWDLEEAAELARGAAAQMAGSGYRAFLERLSTKPRPKWRADLNDQDRVAAAAAIFTRLRVVRPDGRPKLGFTGPPEEAPDGCRPWFEDSEVLRAAYTVVFGHWAQLGYYRQGSAICLDSGCVYGGSLSALRLDDGEVFHEPVADSEVAPMEE
jgi:bis(5'-nucleosyl)-tetraphosphatase (symmetrical)